MGKFPGFQETEKARPGNTGQLFLRQDKMVIALSEPEKFLG